MKIKTLICTILCMLLIGISAFAAANTEEALTEYKIEQEALAPAEQSEAMPSAEPQMPQHGQNPQRGQMPEHGAMPEGGFGGRGGNINFPGQMPMEDSSLQTEKTVEPYNFTNISAVVLLAFGFLFAIFYKRRTF